jgi:lipopolysaccharide/colanic/teichoic acid biosynthesis glycosyltransferase
VKRHVIFSVQVILERLIDILLSFIGLVLLTVPFALIALAIKLDSKGPVFFRQERVGLRGKVFRAWKFRTTKGCSVKGDRLKRCSLEALGFLFLWAV